MYNGTVEEDEKVLETDGGDGYTTVWMNLMLLNCALKMVKFIHPVIYILSQFFFLKGGMQIEGHSVNHLSSAPQNWLDL